MMRVRQTKIFNYDDSKHKKEYKQEKENELKKRWKNEKMYRIHTTEMSRTATDENETWEQLRKVI